MKHLTLEELKATDAYKKKGLIFPHPTELINKFMTIKREYPNVDFTVTVDKEEGAGLKDDVEHTEDIITWGRGLILANIRDVTNDYGHLVIGLIWSYDTTKPVIKVFAGLNASACLNLNLFRADDIYEFSINVNFKSKDDRAKKKIWKRKMEDLLDDVEDYTNRLCNEAKAVLEYTTKMLDTLKNTTFEGRDAVSAVVGTMYIDDVMMGKFDSYTFDYGCRMIFDPIFEHKNKILYCDTIFYDSDLEGIDPGVGSHRERLNLLDFYGALTQRITDGRTEIDLLPNKTIEVSNLFKRYINDSN